MPSVAEELAELRKRSLAKSHASKLQDANGLSTPEQEENAIKESAQKTRLANYTKHAVETLKAGTKAVDKDFDFKVQQSSRKKEDQKKEREAIRSNNAGTKAVDMHLDFQVQKIAQKKQEREKQKEAVQTLNSSGTIKPDFDLKATQLSSKKKGVQVVENAPKKVDPISNTEAADAVEEKKVEIPSVSTEAMNAVDEKKVEIPSSSTEAVDAVEEKKVEVPSSSTEAVDAVEEKKEELPSSITETVDPVAEKKVDVPDASTESVEPVEEVINENGIVETPVIEDIEEVDEIPNIEAMSEEYPSIESMAQPNAVPSPQQRVQNRAERKARKVMERLGMKNVAGITQVTIKMRGNQGFFTIHEPDVFEKNGSYIVFGEARQGSGIPRVREQQARAVQKLNIPQEEKKTNEEVVDVEEVVDDDGVDPKDIELVITQAGCSRAKAVRALKENDGDLVNAIMSLTA